MKLEMIKLGNFSPYPPWSLISAPYLDSPNGSLVGNPNESGVYYDYDPRLAQSTSLSPSPGRTPASLGSTQG